MRSKDSHVVRHTVEHGGGNIYSDVFTLRDGRVLAIHPQDVVLYPNMNAYIQDSDSEAWENHPRIALHGTGGDVTVCIGLSPQSFVPANELARMVREAVAAEIDEAGEDGAGGMAGTEVVECFGYYASGKDSD